MEKDTQKKDSRLQTYKENLKEIKNSMADMADTAKADAEKTAQSAEQVLTQWEDSAEDKWDEMKEKADQVMGKLKEAVEAAKK